MRVFATAAAIVSLMIPSISLAAPVMAKPTPPVAVADKAAKKLPAPTPERLDLARRVMAAEGGVEGFNSMFDALISGVLKGLRPSPQVMIAAAPYQERLMKSLHSHMPRIVEATSVSWARTYTTEELRAQAEYFETPAAQSMIAKLPSLVSDIGQELGWFARQVLLTDPKSAQYLADVTSTEEAPLSWPTPPQASLDALRARIAATPGGEALLHPESLLEKAPGGSKAKGKAKAKDTPPGPMEKRAIALLPTLINDILAIVANHITPEEMQAQSAFVASPAGKSMAAKMESMMDGLTADLTPIIKEIVQDVTTPPKVA